VDPLLTAWVAAARDAGHPACEDFNGADQEGVGVYQVTQRDGNRCSSADAFLTPALDRPNLTILDCTQARRIVWHGTRARGVEVEQGGRTRMLAVEGEVILSAGAYQSPQLLLLSGVGPADELRDLDIEPVADLPEVGRNLQDHVGCMLAYASRTPSAEALPPEHAWAEAGGFLRSNPGLAAPDLQFHAAVGMSRDEGLAPATRRGVSFGPYVARPASRGRVTLRSPEPLAKPRIHHRFLDEASDRDALRDGIRLGLEIARESALSDLVEATGDAVEAGYLPSSDTDEAIDRFVRRSAFAFYHPCGTAAIGPVTDSALRVHGVDGVRVADTSVMPRLITGNTNAPAIMIGERAARVIVSPQDENRG
jgi:choline dehydrogenase-like flavoprotein